MIDLAAALELQRPQRLRLEALPSTACLQRRRHQIAENRIITFLIDLLQGGPFGPEGACRARNCLRNGKSNSLMRAGMARSPSWPKSGRSTFQRSGWPNAPRSGATVDLGAHDTSRRSSLSRARRCGLSGPQFPGKTNGLSSAVRCVTLKADCVKYSTSKVHDAAKERDIEHILYHKQLLMETRRYAKLLTQRSAQVLRDQKDHET
jgi:hypothetical protein